MQTQAIATKADWINAAAAEFERCVNMPKDEAAGYAEVLWDCALEANKTEAAVLANAAPADEVSEELACWEA